MQILPNMVTEFSASNSSQTDWRLNSYSVISRNFKATTKFNLLFNFINITFIKNKHSTVFQISAFI